MSIKKYNMYKKLLENNSDNIYVDLLGDYLISMHVSDVLISDANSFVPEYLIYKKPVIYTKKPNTTGFKNKKLEKMLYVCQTAEEIFKNIELLNENKDLKASYREKNIELIFKYNNKKLVADQIINKILDEFK